MNQSHHLYKAALFKALGHPLRLAILDALRDGAKTVTQLQDLTGAEQASLSQHLKVLRTQHIVNFRRQGTLTYYRNEDAAATCFSTSARRSTRTSFSASVSTSTTCKANPEHPACSPQKAFLSNFVRPVPKAPTLNSGKGHGRPSPPEVSMPRIWKFGDSVNTDDILPGKFAPFMAGEDVFQTFAFHYIRPEFAAQVQPGDVLIGGRNWGLGSSREYAPQALKKLRIGGIVAPSFARIHYRNLLNLGIPAFEYDLTELLHDGDEVSLDAQTGLLTYAGGTVQLPPPPDFLREALREGSILEFFKKHGRFPGEAEENGQPQPTR